MIATSFIFIWSVFMLMKVLRDDTLNENERPWLVTLYSIAMGASALTLIWEIFQ